MRRAMRHANTLGSKEYVLSNMTEHLINQMSGEYGELIRAKELIHETILNEEEKFQVMLSNGMKIIKDETSKIKNNILSGEVAFKLYDTFGFPLDLTEDYFRPLNIKVDVVKFDYLMDQRKQEARKSWKGSGSKEVNKIWFELNDKLGSTEFLGYNSNKAEAKILSIVKEFHEKNSIKIDQDGFIITNQTCFYAESGGQVGDSGKIVTSTGIFEVKDTQKFFGSLFVHIGKVTSGEIKINQDAELEINKNRKENIKANHSATHLLHAALREELGKHVAQKGSYVGPERLRFDFSHSKQINEKQLKIINDRVNFFIKQNDSVITKLMTPDKAIKLGAMALFGEKYGDEVRVVSMGHDKNNVYSIELCGGTHVMNTGEIGQFSVISESSIASGVRRIEALTGETLKKYNFQREKKLDSEKKEQIKKLKDIISQIKNLGGDPKRYEAYEDEKQISNALKYLEVLKSKNILSDKSKNIIREHKKNNINIVTQILKGFPVKEIRSLVDKEKNGEKKIILIFSLNENKTSISTGVSADLVYKYDAVNIVKNISSLLGSSGGGGRKDFAQSGAGEISLQDIDKAISKFIETIN